MPFRREGGVIAPPFDGVECRLYADIPGCACAAAAYADTFPDTLVEVRPDRLEKALLYSQSLDIIYEEPQLRREMGNV